MVMILPVREWLQHLIPDLWPKQEESASHLSPKDVEDLGDKIVKLTQELESCREAAANGDSSAQQRQNQERRLQAAVELINSIRADVSGLSHGQGGPAVGSN